MWETKHTFAFKTVPNVCKIARAVVWAPSINARGIRMAFVHFHIMTFLAFVNVWKRTSILYLTNKIQWIIVSARIRKLNVTKFNNRNFNKTIVSYRKSKILIIKNRTLLLSWPPFKLKTEKRKKETKKNVSLRSYGLPNVFQQRSSSLGRAFCDLTRKNT